MSVKTTVSTSIEIICAHYRDAYNTQYSCCGIGSLIGRPSSNETSAAGTPQWTLTFVLKPRVVLGPVKVSVLRRPGPATLSGNNWHQSLQWADHGLEDSGGTVGGLHQHQPRMTSLETNGDTFLDRGEQVAEWPFGEGHGPFTCSLTSHSGKPRDERQQYWILLIAPSID